MNIIWRVTIIKRDEETNDGRTLMHTFSKFKALSIKNIKINEDHRIIDKMYNLLNILLRQLEVSENREVLVQLTRLQMIKQVLSYVISKIVCKIKSIQLVLH